MSAEDRQRIRGGSFWGLSLIVVVALLAHGYELGCTKAEALAINDDGEPAHNPSYARHPGAALASYPYPWVLWQGAPDLGSRPFSAV